GRGKKIFLPKRGFWSTPEKIPDPEKWRPTLVSEALRDRFSEMSQARQNLPDQVVNHLARIRRNNAFRAADDDCVHAKRVVIQEARHGVISGSFHLEIGKAKHRFPYASAVGGHVSQQVGVADRNTNASALRREKAGCCNRIARLHRDTDPVSEAGRTLYNVGTQGKLNFFMEVARQRLLHLGHDQVVIRHHSVKPRRIVGMQVRSHGDILLQRSRCTDTDDLQTALFLERFSFSKVDVDQRIEFGHHQLDIICSDAGAQHRYAPAPVGTGFRNKLAVAGFERNAVKMGCNLVDTVGVAYRNYDLADVVRE